MSWLPGDDDPVMSPQEAEQEEAEEQDELELSDEDVLLAELGL